MRNTDKKNLRRVLLIHTGGTFGMEKGRPFLKRHKSDEYLNSLFAQVPELQNIAHLELKVLCNLDSSDVDEKIWKNLANLICKSWRDFDGFVVIHGTDTMAYTAAALSFFLQDVSKPIVLTGSQRPLAELRTDARANIIDSVELASLGIPEIMICFDSKVHRGTRVTKYSNEHMQAFRAHNSSVIGEFGVHLTLARRAGQKSNLKNPPAPKMDLRIDSRVACLDCIPGTRFPPGVAEALVKGCKGIILRGFGAGNLPLEIEQWQDICKKAMRKKIPVVVATQCGSGRVSLDSYENGRAFRDVGAMSSHDMSFEALAVKLMIMIGRGVGFEDRHEFFAQPLAQECSVYTRDRRAVRES